MDRLSDKAIEIINELHRERLDYESEYLPLIDCAQRCAAYEDTDMTPEQIKDADDFLKKNWDMPLENLKEGMELIKAKEAGRLVVIPEEKEMTEKEAAEMTGYKCPICKHHKLCTSPHMHPLCGPIYDHFEPID